MGKPTIRVLASLTAAFLIAGCGDATTSPSEAAERPRGGGDSELQTTLAEPAPDGLLSLNVEVLAEGLVNPWSIAFLPNGEILLSERPGRIRVVRDGALLPDPVANVPEVLSWNQGGLFDILVHPNFAENNVIFIAYAHGTRRANGLRIARAQLVDNALEELTILYDATPQKDIGHHFGGRLVWGPDGKIYATIGEGSRYKEQSQSMASSFGAVIRINEDGSIPDDNPGFGENALPELYAKGNRNPQGLVYDRARNKMWLIDHGPRGGDELNIVSAGGNYGWPIASYGIDYNGARITPFTEYEGTIQPEKYWTPSIAPSGLAVYQGELFEGWAGDLLVGAMSSSNGRALHRIIFDGDNIVGEERYLIGERIRDVRVGPDGAIYATSEDRAGAPEGELMRLTPGQQ